MRNVPNKLHQHVGLRAEGTILVGVIWILIGVKGLVREVAVALVPGVWHLLIPSQISGFLWILSGLGAMILAPTKDWSGLSLFLLTIAPGIRFFSYLWSWVVYVIPGIQEGNPRGWFNSLFYLVMILLVVFLSRIPDNIKAPMIGKRMK